MAPASKPTIYSHFPGKEALFEAVVARVINGLANSESYVPEGRTIQDKLTSVGTAIVERFIQNSVGMTRAVIAEAPTFPALSRHVHETSRDRMAKAVSQVLDDATQLSRTLKGPFSAKRSVATAQIFMDLILLPMLIRSLMGEETRALKKTCHHLCVSGSVFFWRLAKAIGRPSPAHKPGSEIGIACDLLCDSRAALIGK